MTTHRLEGTPFHSNVMKTLGHVVDDSTKFVFDFSQIPNTDYTSFFLALPNVLAKQATKVKFTTKSLFETKRRGNQEPQDDIKQSIAYQNPRFISYLTKIVCRSLPRSKILSAIAFESIDLPSNSCQTLADSLTDFFFLNAISFVNVQLNALDFNHFLEKINFTLIEKAKFVNCNLPQNVFSNIVEFLSKNKKNNATIKKLNLSNNNFTDPEIEFIEQNINQTTLKYDQIKYQHIFNQISSQEEHQLQKEQRRKRFQKFLKDISSLNIQTNHHHHHQTRNKKEFEFYPKHITTHHQNHNSRMKPRRAKSIGHRKHNSYEVNYSKPSTSSNSSVE